MKVLGLDTSTRRGAIALCKDTQVVMELDWELEPRSHTEHLVPMINHLLEVSSWTYADLDGLVVAHGPGSFTGLRVGISAAKGIALAHDLPIVGVSSLEVLARNLWGVTGLVVPLFDARKKEIYGAAFRSAANAWTREREDRVEDPRHFLEALDDTDDPVFLIGDGVSAYRALCDEVLGARAVYAPSSAALPRGGHVVAAGLTALEAAEKGSVASVNARYLRAPEAIARNTNE